MSERPTDIPGNETHAADEYPVKGIVIAVMASAPFWAIAAFLVWKLFL